MSASQPSWKEVVVDYLLLFLTPFILLLVLLSKQPPVAKLSKRERGALTPEQQEVLRRWRQARADHQHRMVSTPDLDYSPHFHPGHAQVILEGDQRCENAINTLREKCVQAGIPQDML